LISARLFLVLGYAQKEFKDKISKSPKHSGRFLWGRLCSPAGYENPIIEEVLFELGGKNQLLKVNIDQATQLFSTIGIRIYSALYPPSKRKNPLAKRGNHYQT